MKGEIAQCRLCGKIPMPDDNDWCAPPLWNVSHLCLDGIYVSTVGDLLTREAAIERWNGAMCIAAKEG